MPEARSECRPSSARTPDTLLRWSWGTRTVQILAAKGGGFQLRLTNVVLELYELEVRLVSKARAQNTASPWKVG